MHIAAIGSSNTVGALRGVIQRFGSEQGLTVSLVLDKYYDSLLNGYKVNPSIADPDNPSDILAKLSSTKLLSIGDMHSLMSADAYIIDGTFGGKAYSRTFDPYTLNNKRIRPIMMNIMNTLTADLARIYGKKVIVDRKSTRLNSSHT